MLRSFFEKFPLLLVTKSSRCPRLLIGHESIALPPTFFPSFLKRFQKFIHPEIWALKKNRISSIKGIVTSRWVFCIGERLLHRL